MHTFSTIANPSSLSVRSALYAALCSSLSHLFAVPNTVLSVQYRSYTTVYMVTICSAATGG